MKKTAKSGATLPVLLFAIILSLPSCARVVIHDDVWCADAGKFGAECFNTISENEFSLNKYEWDKLRVGQICSATKKPGLGYSHIKAALEKLCADSNFCSPEQKQAIESIGNKIDEAVKAGAGSDPFDH